MRSVLSGSLHDTLQTPTHPLHFLSEHEESVADQASRLSFFWRALFSGALVVYTSQSLVGKLRP
jgi:hypothetical protein